MHLHISMEIQTNTIADTLILEISVKIGDKDIDSGVSLAPYNLVVTSFYNEKDIESNIGNTRVRVKKVLVKVGNLVSFL